MRHLKATAVLGVLTANLLLRGTSALHINNAPQPYVGDTWHSMRFELVTEDVNGATIQDGSGCCRNSAGGSEQLFNTTPTSGPGQCLAEASGYSGTPAAREAAWDANCKAWLAMDNSETNPWHAYQVQLVNDGTCEKDGEVHAMAFCAVFSLLGLGPVAYADPTCSVPNQVFVQPANTRSSCYRRLKQTWSPTTSPTTAPTAAPASSAPTLGPTTPGPTTSPSIAPSHPPTTSGPTTSPSIAPSHPPTTSDPTVSPTTSVPTTSPTSYCESPGCDCFRQNTFQCSLYVSGAQCAAGYVACSDAAGTTFSVVVTFDVDYTAMSDGARASLATALAAPFCARILAAGVPCQAAADLVVELAPSTAGPGRRARRSAATNATVALPSGTSRDQADAISDSIAANAIVVPFDGGSVTSTAAGVTAHSVVGPNANEAKSSEEGSDSLLLVLVIVLIIMFIGCVAMVRRHRNHHSPHDLHALPKGGLGGTPIAFDKNSGMTPAQQIARAQLQQARLEGAATTGAQPPSQPSTGASRPNVLDSPPTQEETYAVLASKSKRNIQAAPPQETYAALGPQAHDAATAAAAAPPPRQETYASLASQSVRKPVAGAPGGPYAKLSPGSTAPVVGNAYQYLAAANHVPPVPTTDRPAPLPGTETYETIDDVVEPTYEVDQQSYAHAVPLGNDDYELPTEPRQAPIDYEPPIYASEQDPAEDYDNAEALGGEEILNKLWMEGHNPTYGSDQQDCSPGQSRRGTDGYIDYGVPDVPEEAPNNYAVPTSEGLVKHDTVWEKHDGKERPLSITGIATEYGYEAPMLKQDPALATAEGSRRPSQAPLTAADDASLSRMGSVGRTLERDKLGAMRMTPVYSQVPAFRDSRMPSDEAAESWTEKPIMQPADQAAAPSALYPDIQYAYDRPGRASLVNPTYETPDSGQPVQPVYSDINLDAVTGQCSEDEEPKRLSLVNPTYETPDSGQPVQPVYSDMDAVAGDRRLPAAKSEKHDVVYMSGGEVAAKPAVDAVYATAESKTARRESKTARRASIRKVSEAGGPPLPERAEGQPETEFVVVVEGSL